MPGMNGIARHFRLATLCLLPVPAAAASPSVLSTAEPGQWEISRSGGPAVQLCLARIENLAQFEHRDESCARDVIRDGSSSATISYTCKSGGFGESVVTLLTPRSLRVKTQGISANAPFNYTFQARRLGNCPSH